MNDWQKLIVPLIFLAFWGLKQIFEREPQRQPGRPAGFGPRPDAPPGGPRPGVAPGVRDPAVRWSGQGAPPSRRDDEVIIIRPESILPDSPSARPGANRRRSQPRPTSQRIEPERPRPITSAITPLVAQPLRGLGPISLAKQADVVATTTASAPLAAPAIAQALRSPERLREAFILNEVLQPPVALRRIRRPN